MFKVSHALQHLPPNTVNVEYTRSNKKGQEYFKLVSHNTMVFIMTKDKEIAHEFYVQEFEIEGSLKTSVMNHESEYMIFKNYNRLKLTNMSKNQKFLSAIIDEEIEGIDDHFLVLPKHKHQGVEFIDYQFEITKIENIPLMLPTTRSVMLNFQNRKLNDKMVEYVEKLPDDIRVDMVLN